MGIRIVTDPPHPIRSRLSFPFVAQTAQHDTQGAFNMAFYEGSSIQHLDRYKNKSVAPCAVGRERLPPPQ